MSNSAAATSLQAKKELQQFLKAAQVKRKMVEKVTLEGSGRSFGKKAEYVYLYDTFLQDKQYSSILSNIERRLSDFEINGKIVKMTSFTNPRSLAEDEIKRGAKTVIMVGNDDTLVRVLLKAADLDVIFGFLPVGMKKNHFAKVLGLPLNEKACDVIAARKIEKIDYGVVNQKNFFLCYLYIPEGRFKINCDDNFALSSGKEKWELAIANLLPPPFASEKFTLHPQDGKMELYLRPKSGGMFSRLMKKEEQKTSIFFFKKIVIKSEKQILVIADGRELHEVNLSVEVNKKKLALIVGKTRQF